MNTSIDCTSRAEECRRLAKLTAKPEDLAALYRGRDLRTSGQAMPARRFPPPWSVEETGIVVD
jgi:hypothetical protein